MNDTFLKAASARGGFPLRHREQMVTTDGGMKPWSDLGQQLLDGLGGGFVAVVIGNRGTGKTQMAMEVARQVIVSKYGDRNDTPARYVSAMALFVKIRAGYRKEGASEETIMEPFKRCNLLVIDEVQERGETAWEDRLLTHIVDHRYGAKLDTILIGNITAKDLRTSLGESIVSRAQECGMLIECTWPSFRSGK